MENITEFKALSFIVIDLLIYFADLLVDILPQGLDYRLAYNKRIWSNYIIILS